MYNGIGNILSVTTYDYTPKGTEPSGSGVTESYTYSTTYPDRLTNHNGKVAMYNSMGCPISFNGMGATWTRGKLSQLSKGTFRTGSESFGFNYNAMGQRVTKTYNYTPPTTGLTQQIYGQVTQYSKAYHYDHTGRLIEESINETQYGVGVVQKSIKYLYDGNTVIGLQYNNGTNVNTYYYQRNLLGDVIAIYDANGIKVVEYVYDAFGNCTILANATSNYPLANDNPIRYRGYYYDADTNLYYLNSRYYSPELRRFISPDDTSYLDSESVNGLNLYCYCNNDPVNYADPSGHFPWWILMVALLLFTPVGGVALQAATTIIAYPGILLASLVNEDIKEDIESIGGPFKCLFNTKENVNANYVSIYRGVPVFRTNLARSGSFGAIFLQRNFGSHNPNDVLNHERGHCSQLMMMGIFTYAFTVGIPSPLELGGWSKQNHYNDAPWEAMANIMGGTTHLFKEPESYQRAWDYYWKSLLFFPSVISYWF